MCNVLIASLSKLTGISPVLIVISANPDSRHYFLFTSPVSNRNVNPLQKKSGKH
jgi:hypothetical protein